MNLRVNNYNPAVTTTNQNNALQSDFNYYQESLKGILANQIQKDKISMGRSGQVSNEVIENPELENPDHLAESVFSEFVFRIIQGDINKTCNLEEVILGVRSQIDISLLDDIYEKIDKLRLDSKDNNEINLEQNLINSLSDIFSNSKNTILS